MMRIELILAAAVLASIAVGCESGDEVGELDEVGLAPGQVVMTGTVRYHNAGMAIGGETDPYGTILADNGVYDRLYLRHNGSLESPAVKEFEGRRVEVAGTMDTVSAGGVETPRRTFPVLVVDRIGETEVEDD